MNVRLPQAEPLRPIVLFAVPALLLTCLLMIGMAGVSSQQFSELALAFLHGHLYFLHSIGGIGQDPVLYQHHRYWDEGVFPAIVLLPFVAIFYTFHLFFYQGYIEWLLVLGIMYFVYALGRRLRYSAEDSLILAFGFVLGSAFASAAAVSSGWLLAQVITTFLLFWSLYEYFGRRRWWLIGTICACIFLTRSTAAPIVVFFALELWQGTSKLSSLRRFLPLALPLVGAISLQGLYNFLRFHDPLNGGYEYQLLAAAPKESRALGTFSLRHLPTNLYSLVFGAPGTVSRTTSSWTLKFPYIEGNHNGISIFITSPYYLYLFGRKWAVFARTARHLLVAAGISCLGVLCFYGIGREQISYRYSLDFLPELFVVLMLVYSAEHPRLSRGMKLLLLSAGILNVYLVAATLLQ